MSDEILAGLVMRDLAAGGVELDASGQRMFRLLLSSKRVGAIPFPDSNGALLAITDEVQAAIGATAEKLVGPLQELRQVWQPVAGDGVWEQVAPSLVVGWLLSHVGALQLLKALGLSAAAVDLVSEDLESGVVLSFFRVSEANGVAHLLGGPYESGWLVRQVLKLPLVLATLGSADADGELISYTTEPLRLLNAFVEENRRAFYPSTYRLTLPILSPASLQRVDEHLATISRLMAAEWPKLINLFDNTDTTPGQWLRLFSYCVGKMTNIWLQEQLLPPVVPLEPDQRVGLFRRRKPRSGKPPCGLCFWRDVDALWELGMELAK